MFIASMMPSSHLILWRPLLLLHVVLCWQFPNLRSSSDISSKHQMKLQIHTSNCLLGMSTWMSNHQVKFKCPKLSFWNFTHSHPNQHLLQSSPSQLKATLFFLLEKVSLAVYWPCLLSFSEALYHHIMLSLPAKGNKNWPHHPSLLIPPWSKPPLSLPGL